MAQAVVSSFLEEHQPQKLPGMTAAYHVNAIAVQQVTLQHVAPQSCFL